MCLQADFNNNATDLHLRDLQVADNFLILSMRLWSQRYLMDLGQYKARKQPAINDGSTPQPDNQPPTPNWRHGFETVGIDEAIAGFDLLMSILHTHCRPSLEFRHYACPTLSDNEAWLLSCAMLAQQQLTPALQSRWPAAYLKPACGWPALCYRNLGKH